MSTEETNGLILLNSGAWAAGWTLSSYFECNGQTYSFWYMQGGGLYETDRVNTSSSGGDFY